MSEFMREQQADSPEARLEGHRRAEHAIGLLEVIASTGAEAPKENLQSAETRVEVLRSMDTNKFLDILSVSNGLLRGSGFTRWKGEAAKVQVSSVVMGVDLEPPSHAEVPFSEFFEQLKKEINPENKDFWAAKLYIAMVFAHLFSDGNGRLARNAYSFVKDGALLNEEISANRSAGIAKFCHYVNSYAVLRLMQRDKILPPEDESLRRINHYAVKPQHGDEIIVGSLSEDLQYVAANKAGLVPEGAETVFREDWNADELARFQEEYEKARLDWFWASQGFIDQYKEWAVEQLDQALNMDEKLAAE